MKIAVISPSRNHLEDMGSVLQATGHATCLFEGGKSQLREVAEQEQPDLMLVDGMCCDPAELAQVEYVTTHLPAIAVVLLCSTHTPEFLINSMRAGVREVLPSPVHPPALEAAVQRVAAKLAGASRASAGKVLAFMPCKGGSGRHLPGHQPGLAPGRDEIRAPDRPEPAVRRRAVLRARRQGPFHAGRCRQRHQPAGCLAAGRQHREDHAQLQRPGGARRPGPRDGGQARAHRGHPRLAVKHYDFVLLDMGRSLDTLAIKALDRAWRIFPVLQASLPAIRNAHKLLDAFRSLGYPPDKTELIVNRFESSGEIGLDQVRRSLGSAAHHRARLLPGSERLHQPRRAAREDGPLQRGGPPAHRAGAVAEPAPGRQNRGGLLAGFSGGLEHERNQRQHRLRANQRRSPCATSSIAVRDGAPRPAAARRRTPTRTSS